MERPKIEHLVETGVYADDLHAAEVFYSQILGLEVAAREPGRHVFFRVADSMLLVFNPDESLKPGKLPPHGARGPSHFALGVPDESFEEWRSWLQACGIEIEAEVSWPRGGTSLYFRDPAGNSVELVTRGLWGLPAGW